MEYRQWGQTGNKLSVLAAGNTTPAPGVWGNEERVDDAVRALHAMVDAGVNLIDTASSYGDGESERIVGRALKGLDRSRLCIATKFGMTFVRRGGKRQIIPDLRADACIASCERSLRRMGLDYVDIYMPHLPPASDGALEELAEALYMLRQQGKIRSVGLSNFPRAQIQRMQTLIKISVVEMPYSMLDRDYREDLEWAVAQGLFPMVYGALGDGILAGAYREAPVLGAEDTRVGYGYFREPGFSAALRVYRELEEIAARRGVAAAEVAINWTRQQTCVGSVILGTGKEQHARGNAAAVAWALDDEELRRIDEALERYVGQGINRERFFEVAR